MKDTTFDSKMFKNGVNALIDNLSEEELKLFVNTIYSIIEETKTNSFKEFLSNLNKNLQIVVNNFGNLDETQKKLMSKVANMFIKESFSNIKKA